VKACTKSIFLVFLGGKVNGVYFADTFRLKRDEAEAGEGACSRGSRVFLLLAMNLQRKQGIDKRIV